MEKDSRRLALAIFNYFHSHGVDNLEEVGIYETVNKANRFPATVAIMGTLSEYRRKVHMSTHLVYRDYNFVDILQHYDMALFKAELKNINWLSHLFAARQRSHDTTL